VTLLSLAANVVSVAGGPFWPTIPGVDLGPPDESAAAFDGPFLYTTKVLYLVLMMLSLNVALMLLQATTLS
jgi:hypothetical protein